MKKFKKLAAVLSGTTVMSMLLTVMSYAETTAEQAKSDGALIEFIVNLFKVVDWGHILKILGDTFKTIFDMIGSGQLIPLLKNLLGGLF